MSLPLNHLPYSTLRSSKSKEFTQNTTPKAIGDQESLTASNEPMASSGYTPIAILNDPSARKCSSGHLSQAAIPQVSTCTVGTVSDTVFSFTYHAEGIMHLIDSKSKRVPYTRHYNPLFI